MKELKEIKRIGGTDCVVHNNGHYPPEVMAQCYGLYRLYRSVPKVAEMTGVSQSSIYKWIRDIENNSELRQRYQNQMKSIEESLLGSVEMTMQKALQQVYAKLPEASAAQAATIFGILFDKRSVMMGTHAQTATNVYIDTAGMSDSDKADLLRRALSRTDSVDTDYEEIE